MEGIRIRRAATDDVGPIAQLHIRVWQWAYRGQIPDAYLDGLTQTLDRRTAWRSEMLANVESASRTWVALLDHRIVGFADTGPSRDDDASDGTGELYSIHVDGSIARRGVGRALLSHAVGDLHRRSFAPLTLWVLDTNERARRFYEALGWTVDGSAKTDVLPGFDLHEVRYRHVI